MDLHNTMRRGKSAARKVRSAYLTEGTTGVVRRSRNWIRRRRAGVVGPDLPTAAVAHPDTWPLSVLSVAELGLPQCYHYRVEQKRQILAGLGVPFAHVGPQDPAEALSRLQLARLLIVYRLPETPELQALVGHAARLRVPVVYELDDLVHHEHITAANPNLDTLPKSLRAAVIRGSRGYARALDLATVNLASTAALAEDMTACNGRPAYVVDNGIDEQMLAIASRLADVSPPSHPVVTYGSGSRAHDHDFALAAPALARWLADTPGGRLKVIGPVRIPEVLEGFAGRIDRITETLEYPDFLRELRTSTMAIAPLTDDEFNRYKSQVKYLEAALVGVPLIASPTVYARYVQDGVTGIIAGDEDQWYQALRRLGESPDERARIAAAAREHVRRWELGQEPTRQMSEFLRLSLGVDA